MKAFPTATHHKNTKSLVHALLLYLSECSIHAAKAAKKNCNSNKTNANRRFIIIFIEKILNKLQLAKYADAFGVVKLDALFEKFYNDYRVF